ncbi:cold shock domain-containing protein 3-like [Helianthus annuus]|uniref:cold shock domain-containing protein 3-like n=1 Tax=Helianthus annuus TaxID=4232 RepID=UPI000B8FCA33|nr:cold shock domain-containing protein 3-like [Helianthus annuus]
MKKLSLNPIEKTETHAESGDKKRKHSNLNQATCNTKGSNNKKRDTNPPQEAKTLATMNDAPAKRYLGTLPVCNNCKRHHEGVCRIPKCDKCGKLGHHTEDCWGKGKNGNGNRNGASNRNDGNGNGNGNGNGARKNHGCFSCGSKDHYMKDCPKGNNAQARAFVIRARNAREDPNAKLLEAAH